MSCAVTGWSSWVASITRAQLGGVHSGPAARPRGVRGDYVREHITHGYAVTVHTAQGVTADTSHVVPGESTTRAALYMAMTCRREANNAYLYERAPEHEYRAGDPGRAYRSHPDGSQPTQPP